MRGRKPRLKSHDMCVYCGNTECDPIWPDTPAKRKIQKRVQNGLCPGCGHVSCTCKSNENFPRRKLGEMTLEKLREKRRNLRQQILEK